MASVRNEFDESDNKVRWALLGRQIEAFLASDGGRYLTERAANESEAAIEAMKTVDPADSKQVAALQRRLLIPELVVAWLREAAHVGRAAEAQIEQERGR